MRPLSESTSRLSGKIFERKFVALGRIVSQWEDIVGSALAGKVQPVKIHYQKTGRGKDPVARLDIAAREADAAILRMQVGAILERINILFGSNWITSIRFVTIATNEDDLRTAMEKNKREKARSRTLTGDETSFLNNSLEEIKDSDIKARLESLGAAIIRKDSQ